jgi:hypothetical protein
MLTDKEITIIESIYLAIDGGLMPESISYQLIQSVQKKSIEQYAYLMWLLNRWKYELRSHKTRHPKRITHTGFFKRFHQWLSIWIQ